MRRLGVLLAALLIITPGLALAQMDSREGIALQNQILQLRQELETLRRAGAGGAAGGALAPPQAQPTRPTAAQAELLPALLERVQRMEEELRTVRGRAEQAEFRERQLREAVEKLDRDMDFRLQQLENQRQGATVPGAPAPARTAAGAAAGAAVAASRTPQRALADGQSALARRDFTAAEAAAREVIATREQARQVDAQILLGDSLMGQRNFSGAFSAYDAAYQRSPQGSRAPEAVVGISNSLIAQNRNRDACALLDSMRSSTSNLSGALAERAADARRRAQCR